MPNPNWKPGKQTHYVQIQQVGERPIYGKQLRPTALPPTNCLSEAQGQNPALGSTLLLAGILHSLQNLIMMSHEIDQSKLCKTHGGFFCFVLFFNLFPLTFLPPTSTMPSFLMVVIKCRKGSTYWRKSLFRLRFTGDKIQQNGSHECHADQHSCAVGSMAFPILEFLWHVLVFSK